MCSEHARTHPHTHTPTHPHTHTRSGTICTNESQIVNYLSVSPYLTSPARSYSQTWEDWSPVCHLQTTADTYRQVLMQPVSHLQTPIDTCRYLQTHAGPCRHLCVKATSVSPADTYSHLQTPTATYRHHSHLQTPTAIYSKVTTALEMGGENRWEYASWSLWHPVCHFWQVGAILPNARCSPLLRALSPGGASSYILHRRACPTTLPLPWSPHTWHYHVQVLLPDHFHQR